MRPIDDNTFDAALALNNRFAADLSFATAESFRTLIEGAFYARWTEGLEGFVIAFCEGATYQSPNYRWFSERYPRFVYVDRIVVRPEARGGGHARSLYGDLFEVARRSGRSLIGCEINAVPPNPGSDAFHARLGFDVVGEALLEGGAKRVRYLVHEIKTGA